MARHVVAALAEIPPGSRKLVEAAGRPIVIFNVNGELFAISSRCPHAGGALEHSRQVGLILSSAPGEYSYARKGEIIRCPWHGWEFDLRTGQSWCDPSKVKVKSYEVTIERGGDITGRQGELSADAQRMPGPFTADVFEVSIEDDYVVVQV